MRNNSHLSIALITCLALLPVHAQDEAAALDEETVPSPKELIAVTTIEAGRYKIGEVEINAKTREITFPATVNMREGLIEFPVTHINGRVHEAIFTTEVLPIQLQTALLLTNYQPSREAFPLPPEKEVPLGEPMPPPKFPPVNPASHVRVSFSWTDGTGKRTTTRLESVLAFAEMDESKPLVEYADQSTHWIFTGSTEEMGAEVFDMGGAMVGTRLEKECILNPEPHPKILESVWFVKAETIPELGTPVKIHFEPAPSPSKNNPPKSK